MGNKKESASLVVGRPEKPAVPAIQNKNSELRYTQENAKRVINVKTPTNQT